MPPRVGNVKSGFQSEDHSGWVKLDGRAVSTLTPTQRTAASAIGFTTTLPAAGNSAMVMNGQTPGAVTGSNTVTLTHANLPNITLTAASAGSHTHSATAPDNDRTDSQDSQGLPINGHNGFRTTDQSGPARAGLLSTDGAHTHSVPLGGSNTPFSIMPQSLSVILFVYLGL